MIRFLTVPLLSLSLALSPFSDGLAEEVDVFTGEAVVADQGAGERRNALPGALEHVLQKYGGMRELDEVEGIETALEGASSLLLTFYYRNVEREQADGSVQNELRLVAKFSPPEVEEMARTLGLPLWQADRNPLEIWVVIDNGRERQVMPLETAYVRDTLDDAARWRGQPLRWPEPDEEGMYPVDMQLLWGGYTEDLAGPTGVGVLILAARREGLEWSVRSNLGFGGENHSFRVRDLDLEAALVDGMQQAVDQVARISAIAATDLGTWRQEIVVGGIGSGEDYGACLAYLQGLGVVSRIDVVSARPDEVTFDLELSALPQYLLDALAVGGLLEPGESENHYVFRGEGNE